MAKNPNQWLRNRRNSDNEPLSSEELDTLANFVKNYDKRSKSAYDKLGSLKKIMLRCVPDQEKLSNPNKRLINEISQKISQEVSNPDTERSWKKDLRAFLRVYKEGEYKELKDKIDLNPVNGDTREVEPWMIYPLETWREICKNAKYDRTAAFVALLYNTGATPGELLKAKLSDIDMEKEEMKIRGNKNHQDNDYHIRPFAFNHLKNYLESHPVVNHIYETNYEQPLWVKTSRRLCKRCNKMPQNCEEEGCGNFQPKEVEAINYRTIYKQWRNAVDKSNIEIHHQEQGIKMKYARKSVLTEAVKNDIGERLEDFARWKAGSDQKKHYVNLTNEEIVKWQKDTFGRNIIEEDSDEQLCDVCGVWNDKKANVCRNCQRHLSENARKEVKDARDIVEDLANFPMDEVKEVLKEELLEEMKEDTNVKL